MNNQKQLIILIVITASLTSFLAGYLLIQPSHQTTDSIQQQRGALIDRFSTVTDNATPTPLPPGLLQATTNPSLSATSAPDSNSVLYYHPDNGHVSKVDLETRLNTIISATNLVGLTNVIWSPNKNRVITISRSSKGPIYQYYDYTTHEHGSLGTNIKDAIFSPDSQRVAVLQSAGGDSAIQIMDLGSKNAQIVLKTRLDNIHLAWPSDHVLAFTANDDTGTQSLYTVSENGDLSQILEGEDGLMVRWSPDGSKFLYSDRESGAIVLHVFDIASSQDKVLPVSTTAGTCAWMLNQTSAICADEVQGETSVNQINLADLSAKTLFANLIISPQTVFLSHLENFLIMTSAGDQSVWELKLAQ